MSRICLVLFCLLGATHLAAQGTVVLPEKPLDPARATLRDELLRLRDTLVRCNTAFGKLSQPDQGEEVRGYGNHRAVLVQGLRKYEQTLAWFFNATGIKVRPLGAEGSPLAGSEGGNNVDTHLHIVLTEPVWCAV